jgi:hypothetical protein
MFTVSRTEGDYIDPKAGYATCAENEPPASSSSVVVNVPYVRDASDSTPHALIHCLQTVADRGLHVVLEFLIGQ